MYFVLASSKDAQQCCQKNDNNDRQSMVGKNKLILNNKVKIHILT